MAPKRLIVAQRSRTARRQARAQLGALRNQIVARATLLRYERAVGAFYNYLDDIGRSLPDDAGELDDLACRRIEDLWQDGDARAYAGDLLSGLSHFIATVKGRLPSAWRLFSAWGRAELPCRAPPLSPDIVLAMCGFALADGHVQAAAAMALGFHALLRSTELTSMVKGDLHLDATRSTGVLNLGLTKGGQRRGVVEHVSLDDANVVRLLSLACEGLERGDTVCGRNGRDFYAKFQAYLARLKLGAEGYKPYSLRRGGATHWFRRSGSMAATCERGRWSNAKTARIYINDGLLVLLDIKLSKAQRELIREGNALWSSLVLGIGPQPPTQKRSRRRSTV